MSTEAQLNALLGAPLRVLLVDRRTLQGHLESIDRSSLLLSNTLETRPPPTTATEQAYYENKDRYWPRSDAHMGLEIKGLGLAREIGGVVVNLKDVVKVEMEERDWRKVQISGDVM